MKWYRKIKSKNIAYFIENNHDKCSTTRIGSFILPENAFYLLKQTDENLTVLQAYSLTF